jgi:signal transduction histidine kinase/DNA-binding response OmpR family regulator
VLDDRGNRRGQHDALIVAAKITIVLAVMQGLLILSFAVCEVPPPVAALIGIVAHCAIGGPLIYWVAVAPLHRRLTMEAGQRLDAERTTEQQSAYFSTMSHELRTPLNAVLGMADLLHDQPLPVETRSYVDVIRSSGSTLLALINDVLDLSKMESQHLQLEALSFDPQQLIEETLSQLAPIAFGKGVSLAANVMMEEVGTVVGDQTRLRQVLYNLLGNAVKFTTDGEVVLRARRIMPTEPQSGSVRIEFSVTDSGIGIAAEHLPQLFDPFIQAESSTARRFGGTGLGLAISKRLVEAMGGTIGVTSEPGHGTTFYFSVLFDEWSPAPPRIITLGGTRLLVVSDSEFTVQTITRSLTGSGAHIDVQSGAGCVAAIAQHHVEPYHLVLVDHALISGDGCQTIARLSGLPATADSKYVLVSAPGQQICAEARAAGATQLTKPVAGAGLDVRIGELLGRHTSGLPAVPKPAGADLTGMRVLIADDHVVNQRVLQLTLERLGLAVDVVSDGEQAVNAVLAGQFDAVLMDLHMPVTNGLQATRRIRARQGSPKPVIIGLTAAASSQDRDDCIGAGMDGYLTKPVRAEDLHRMLTECLSALPSPEELAYETGALPADLLT